MLKRRSFADAVVQPLRANSRAAGTKFNAVTSARSAAARAAFQQPAALIGQQPERIGTTVVWVLPNPSGLNAHYPPLKLVEEFRRLNVWLPSGLATKSSGS